MPGSNELPKEPFMLAIPNVWLIWSHEHQGWWKANRNGYTVDVHEAGRYTIGEAVLICTNANCYLRPHGPPNEIMTPAPENFPKDQYTLTGHKHG